MRVESRKVLRLADLMPYWWFSSGDKILLLLVHLLITEWRYICVVLDEGLIGLYLDLLYSGILFIIGGALYIVVDLFFLVIVFLLVFAIYVMLSFF